MKVSFSSFNRALYNYKRLFIYDYLLYPYEVHVPLIMGGVVNGQKPHCTALAGLTMVKDNEAS